jgi:hypothetical protein
VSTADRLLLLRPNGRVFWHLNSPSSREGDGAIALVVPATPSAQMVWRRSIPGRRSQPPGAQRHSRRDGDRDRQAVGDNGVAALPNLLMFFFAFPLGVFFTLLTKQVNPGIYFVGLLVPDWASCSRGSRRYGST